MSEWRTLIVEDDPMVADLHRRLVSKVPGFAVVGIAETAEEAWRLLGVKQPHVVLLDLSLPGRSGMTLLRGLRGCGATVEVIVVTASRGAEVVRATAHLGIVDYLVKPFTPERLHEALLRFRDRMASVGRGPLEQAEVDALYAGGPRRRSLLPKDLSTETLAEVRSTLGSSESTADTVATELGIARVTARRYLEYLVTTGQATVQSISSGPGRPRKTYRLTALAGLDRAD